MLRAGSLLRYSRWRENALRIEFWGYTTQVRLRGLTENKRFEPAQAGFVCVAAISNRQFNIFFIFNGLF